MVESSISSLQPIPADDDGTIADQIDALQGVEMQLQMDLDDLNSEKADAIEYETASSEVSALEEQLMMQQETQRTALENAANKPVTDEIEDEVQRLLGVFELLLPDPGPLPAS